MSRENKPYLVVDTETKGLKFDVLFCVGVARINGETEHIVLNWERFNEQEELQDYSRTDEYRYIQSMLDRYYCIGHNLVYDISVLRAFGFDLTMVEYDDTMLISYLLYPLRPDGHSLRAWGERLGVPKLEHTDFTQYTEEMGLYCEQDCLVTLKLHQQLLPELQADKKAFDLYEKVDKPMVLATVLLQNNGIGIDTNTWNKQTSELEVLKDATLGEIRSIVPYAPSTTSKVKTERRPELIVHPTTLRDLEDCEGKYDYVGTDDSGIHTYKKFMPFNPDSNTQIIWALTKFYGWRPTELTPNGNPRCDDDILSDIANPFAEHLCRYATLSKLVGTYGRSFTNAVRSDGRIHANFNPCVTATGRYSSSHPNLSSGGQ